MIRYVDMFRGPVDGHNPRSVSSVQSVSQMPLIAVRRAIQKTVPQPSQAPQPHRIAHRADSSAGHSAPPVASCSRSDNQPRPSDSPNQPLSLTQTATQRLSDSPIQLLSLTQAAMQPAPLNSWELRVLELAAGLKEGALMETKSPTSPSGRCGVKRGGQVDSDGARWYS